MNILNLIWYMTISEIQIDFNEGGYGSNLTEVMALDRPKNGKIWFLLTVKLN